MRVMCLIWAPAGARPEPATAEFAEESAAYREYTARVNEAGVFRGGDRLESPSTARRVRVRNGEVLVEEGGVEAAEVLGGFYMLDCADLDEALRWASELPTAQIGTIEVRPIRLLH